MSQVGFDKFLELVQLDDGIYELSQDKIKLNQLKSQFEQDLQKQINAKDEQKHALVDLQKKCDTMSLDLDSLNDKLSKIRKKLEDVSSAKEYDSLQSELNSLLDKEDILQNELLGCWVELEATQKANEKSAPLFDGIIEEIKNNIEKTEFKLTNIDKSIEVLEDSRNSKEVGIDPQFLDNYYTMQRKIHNPVVAVSEKQTCSGCFFALTKQDLAKLKSQEYINCSDCYRMIYTKK